MSWLCVHSVNHTGKTHVRQVGQSAASWPCSVCTQPLVDKSQQCHPRFSSREGSNGPVQSPPPTHLGKQDQGKAGCSHLIPGNLWISDSALRSFAATIQSCGIFIIGRGRVNGTFSVELVSDYMWVVQGPAGSRPRFEGCFPSHDSPEDHRGHSRECAANLLCSASAANPWDPARSRFFSQHRWSPRVVL